MLKAFSTIATVLAGLAAAGPVEAMPLASFSHGASLLDVQLASGGCGAGHRRTASGHCVAEMNPNTARHCQPGMHAISFPNGAGYRCVHNR